MTINKKSKNFLSKTEQIKYISHDKTNKILNLIKAFKYYYLKLEICITWNHFLN